MNESESTCPFCSRLARGDVTHESLAAAAFPDAYPLSPGHTLVIPRRHVADWFALTPDELTAILGLAGVVRSEVALARRPDGWNIGVNVGEAGGQTIGHAHLHLIPRYTGDRSDPRGGVRWIFPERAAYWTRQE